MSKRAIQAVLALSVVLMATGIILKVTGDGGADAAGTVAVSLASVGSIVAAIGSSFRAAREDDSPHR
ncbi:hypothetical protein OG423_12160 [Micromonospora zamorensis]|uniref:hypothetical protein n=1 Tax=Micromonospora zamorensis TaxID=709883 RepID=UPI002E290A30|nr:hypothetical protein [Micromonospora zamorensis]WSK51043.1 hypothetical protein OG423_12160 [Micromonospora zamorensis]